MEELKNIKEILEKNKRDIESIEKSLDKINSKNYLIENENFKKELEILKIELIKNKKEINELTEENIKLKNVLTENLNNQKLSMLTSSKNNLNEIFINNGVDSLSELENQFKNKINFLKNNAKKLEIENINALNNDINNLEAKVNNLFNEMILKREEMKKETKENIDFHYDNLFQNESAEKYIEKNKNKINFEMKLGNNLVNIVGVFLVLLGVIFGLKYAYNNILQSNVLRSILSFALGAIFILLGEFFQRKEKSFFGSGFSAGGIAILFASDSISYFVLQVMNTQVAIFICVIISVLAFLLSLRYDSKVIAIFAYIGGYLPIFVIKYNAIPLQVVMIYFLILNAYTILMSYYKKWEIIYLCSFFVNAFSSFVLVNFFGQELTLFTKIIFISLNFLMYFVVPLSNSFKNKNSVSDISIFTLYANTFINAVTIYLILYLANYKNFGYITIGYFVFYLALSVLSKKFFSFDKKIQVIFKFAALTFFVLVVPTQFSLDVLFLGWLVQGVCLFVYGLIKTENWFKVSGLILLIIDILIFYFMEAIEVLKLTPKGMFSLSFAAIGLFIILVSYIYCENKNILFYKNESKPIKIISTIFFWIYLMYSIVFIKNQFIKEYISFFLILTIELLVSFCYANVLKRIKCLSIYGVKFFLAGIEAIAIFLTVIVTMTSFDEGNLFFWLNIILNFVSVYSLYKFIGSLTKNPVRKQNGFVEVITTVYGLLLIILFLLAKLEFNFFDLTISFIIMGTSIFSIIFGFVSKKRILRIFGLYISLATTAKLFIFDLSSLTQGMRILSYFAFGISLISISFVYQYFNKKIKDS